jgi:hypothetical protein
MTTPVMTAAAVFNRFMMFLPELIEPAPESPSDTGINYSYLFKFELQIKLDLAQN